MNEELKQRIYSLRRIPELQTRKLKDATRLHLLNLAHRHQYAVTLTLKPHELVSTSVGKHYRLTNERDAEATASRFLNKLNRLVFKNAAKRFNKTLKSVVVLQGLKKDKHLHLHLAISDVPQRIAPSKFKRIAVAAMSSVPLIDEQFDVAISDSGWIDYICDEVTHKDTDTVLWQICS